MPDHRLKIIAGHSNVVNERGERRGTIDGPRARAMRSERISASNKQFRWMPLGRRSFPVPDRPTDRPPCTTDAESETRDPSAEKWQRTPPRATIHQKNEINRDSLHRYRFQWEPDPRAPRSYSLLHPTTMDSNRSHPIESTISAIRRMNRPTAPSKEENNVLIDHSSHSHSMTSKLARERKSVANINTRNDCKS